MSRTLSASRRGSRGALTGLTGLALALLATLALAPQANAAFTTGKCAGADVTGRGASFARDAHGVFNTFFKLTYCAGTPGAAVLDVTYQAQGSGAGRTSVKVRNDEPRFGMSDEPPSQAEIAQMNTGVGSGDPATDVNPNDNGQIHVVPGAVGAVAPLVNFPDGCDVGQLDAASRTAEQMSGGGAPFPLGLVRVRFTKDEFEKIWAKDATHDNWVDVFPELTGDADCNEPIVRIVRFDESGTSFAFKDYLRTINGARDWLGAFGSAGTGGTRRWPGTTYGPRQDCPQVSGVHPNGPGADSTDPLDPGADQLTSSCFNGNQGIVDKLLLTDGSVGYSDISTARKNNPSLAITPRASAAAAFDNDAYWTQVPSGPGLGEFEEPTVAANGFRTDGTPGSNCQAAQFQNVPATTLGDWAPVSGVNSADAYAICSMTYGLVFDDNADVWGNTPAEESKAKTVKDYWTSSLSDAAQAQLFGSDYSPLPANILAIARTGIAQVDWNKGSGGGGNGCGGNDGGGGGNTNPPVVNPPAKTPSNQFSVPKTAISSKTGSATVSVKLPGKGKLELLGQAKSGKKTIKVGRVVLTANKAGTFKLTLKPGKKAKAMLKSKGKLKVTLKLTYTPTGGSAKSSTRTVTLKLDKPKKKSGRR